MPKPLLWTDCPSMKQLNVMGGEYYRIGVDLRLCLECDRRTASVLERQAIRTRYRELLDEVSEFGKLQGSSLACARRIAENIFGMRQGMNITLPKLSSNEIVERFNQLSMPDEIFETLCEWDQPSEKDPKKRRMLIDAWKSCFCEYCDLVIELWFTVGRGSRIRLTDGFLGNHSTESIETLLRSDAHYGNVSTALSDWEKRDWLDAIHDVTNDPTRQRIARKIVLDRYSISTQTLSDWIKNGTFPKPIDPEAGKHVFWLDEVEVAMNEKGFLPVHPET